MSIYFATAKEMERLDQIAVEAGLEIRQMMELAGWHMLELLRLLKVEKRSRVVVVCGRGNKGGDGLAAARHLANYGYDVSVVLESTQLKPDPEHHLRLVQQMKIPVSIHNSPAETSRLLRNADVIVDALIGYHLDGAPRGNFARLIELINSSPAKKIAYDVPSGLDATSGQCLGVCIQADATLTLALPKKAFSTPEGRRYSGKVYLADIGIPKFLYEKAGSLPRPDFGAGLKML